MVATQNPAGYRGTFPLPESQLDRFLFKFRLAIPKRKQNWKMFVRPGRGHPVHHISHRTQQGGCHSLPRAVQRVPRRRSVAAYMVEIVRRTRDDANCDSVVVHAVR